MDESTRNVAATETAESLETAAEPSLPLAFDLACIGCSYNLRGLRAEGNCPECGLAIIATLTAFRTQWNAQHIAVWKRGCKLLGISGFLTMAVPVLAIGMGFLGFSQFLLAIPVMLCVAVVAEYLAWAMGLARLSSGHPGVSRVTPADCSVLRWGGWANAAAAGVAAAVLISGSLDATLGVDSYWYFLWGGTVASALLMRMACVVVLSRLLTKTLGAAGHLWKRRHLFVTTTAVLVLCFVQLLATLTLAADGNWQEFGAVVGSFSLLALPVIAGWAAVSVLRAGAAFKLPPG